MPQLQNKYSWLAIPGSAVLLLALYFFFPTNSPETDASFTLIEAAPPQQTEPQEVENPIPQTIMVDVKGQVNKPGVYELPSESRVLDAIQAADGLLDSADDRAINLAMILQDEMSIYVPEMGEEGAMPIQATASNAEASGKVNINRADEAELTSLPGIGPAKAEAIISYRTEAGSFQSIEDLTKVTGIGEKTFEQLKDSITVN